jgi:hypothetical protein
MPAGGPIERLHLREQTTLRTLATIERTTLVRRHEETLKIYHADVRAPGRENAEIPIALMERSHMTTVVVGPMQPHAIDALLTSLLEAVSLPTWRCPNVLFMLPPSAVWIANKISAVPWPTRLHVHVLNESMTSASSVWNAMLGMWNHVKTQPAWEPPNAALGLADYPIKVADLQADGCGEPARAGHGRRRACARPQPAMRSATTRSTPRGPRARCRHAGHRRPARLRRRRRHHRPRAGPRSREDQPADLDLSAAASAQVLRSHRWPRAAWACPTRSTK